MTQGRISAGLAAAALLALPMLPGARAGQKSSKKLISRLPAVLPCSTRLVWTLHSFWYPEALKELPQRVPMAHRDAAIANRAAGLGFSDRSERTEAAS